MQITRSSIDTAKGPATGSPATSTSTPSPPHPPPSRVTANLVHFMPGARTHWHRHPLGQTVFVTEGVGLSAGPDRTQTGLTDTSRTSP